MGHVLENQRISPSPRKIEALMKYNMPKNLKELESFIGLASYFRKFIPNFSIIVKPLSDLRKQNKKFEIKEAQINSFNTIKELLSTTPVLRIFNQHFETEVHTDASIDGYGAILLQRSPEDKQLHPVYYMSKKTTDAERKLTSYELEVLAVIEALKKFRVYLLGLHFKLVTDCKAFATTLNKKDLSTKVARWILFMEEYDYTVEHRSGSQIRHADALSRHPVMTINDSNVLANIKRAQSQDEELQTIRELLKDKPSYNGYCLKNNILYKILDDDELLVVPKAMQREIIKQAHDRGHFAVKKTKELVSKEYFIPQLEDKIRSHIANCIPCVIGNRKRGKQEGELHSLNKGEQPLQTYHVDFLGPLESTNKQYKHILAVIDSFTKFCWLYPTKTTSAREVIVKLQMQSVVFGNPVRIISDRGSAFTSDDFKNYCEAEKINHYQVTTGLPRANGQVERLNATISNVLAKLSIEDPTKWYRFVGDVQQAVNSTYARSTGRTPFELLVGIKMRTKNDHHIRQLVEDDIVASFDDEREAMRKAAKEQILKIQNENESYNLRRKPPKTYTIGDMVAIKRTQFGGGLKLKPKFLGPYRVNKVKSNDTYDVVRVAEGEGSKQTTTCAELMKPWPDENDAVYDAFEPNA